VAADAASCYYWSMRTIREIIKSLSFYRPAVETLKDLRSRVNGDFPLTAEDNVVITKIIDAVIAIAEGSSDKADKKAV